MPPDMTTLPMDHADVSIGRYCGSLKTDTGARSTTPIELGITIYNTSLKKKSSPDFVAKNPQGPCTLDYLLDEVGQVKNRRYGSRSTAQIKFEHALSAINQHAQVIDVLIQQQPDITALVWGAIRLLIGVAAREIDTTEKISDALLEIVNDLGRWNGYVELFNDSIRVRDTAAHLFSHIIDFLVRARAHYQRRKAFRYLKVSFTTYAHKFDESMLLIQKHAVTLEQEAFQAAETRQEEERKAQANHRLLTLHEINKQEKFRDELSVQMRNTVSECEETSKHFRKAAQLKDDDIALKWLQPWPASPVSMPYVEKGTCTWFQRHEIYLCWSEALYNMPLCFCGPTGCGKTAVASCLTDHWKTKTTSPTISYFFQDVSNREQAKPTIFTAALLLQFLQLEEVKATTQYRIAIDQVKTLSKSCKILSGDFPFPLLWSVLCDVAKVVADFTIIVDGLDECNEGSREALCQGLIKLATQPNARIVLLFRHSSALEMVFEKSSFKIEITPALTTRDIELYVTEQITRNRRKFLQNRDEIIEKVPTWCNGSFILSKMMLECLEDAATPKIQLEFLATCPPGIGHFYEKSLSERALQLSDDRVQRRREIFLILLQIYTAPTCEELSVMLALKDGTTRIDDGDKLFDPEGEILRLCGSLVNISKNHVSLMHQSLREFFIQPGRAVDPSIHITLEDSDSILAEKCLLALSQEEYQSPSFISVLLRRNVKTVAEDDEDKYFYQYAATHWFIHLFALAKPAIILVELVARFLGGNEFVSWSEFVLQRNKSQGIMLEVEGKLNIWTSTLSQEIQDYLSRVVANYFVGPYRAVSKIFEDDGGDKELSYLCLFQLGEFFNLSARTDEAFEVKKFVAEGLIGLLGERNPLSLKAEFVYAIEFLVQNQLQEAEENFRRIGQIQREVIGTDRPDCFQSIQRQGLAELYMTKYREADASLTESLSGFFNTVGVTDFQYLLSQLALGYVMEAQGDLKRATLNYEHVWRFRLANFGRDNPMTVAARCALVSTYRKSGLFKEAEVAVEEVIDSRKKVVGLKASTTVDAFIQKIVLYREIGKAAEALKLIEFIFEKRLADTWFERLCQVEHIRALLVFDAGDFESSRKVLQALIDKASEIGTKGRNRSLLWVLLDLATILRSRDREDEALMLFEDLVASIDNDSSSSWIEPLAPSELIIAEKALRLVRKIKLHEAANLLEKNGLRWVRQEDFWMLTGGPAADTGWMKGP